MFGVVAIAIGVLVYLVVSMVVPMIGASVEDATPALGPESQWNTSVNTDLPEASDTWATVSGLLNLIVIVTILGGILQILMSLGVGRIMGGN